MLAGSNPGQSTPLPTRRDGDGGSGSTRTGRSQTRRHCRLKGRAVYAGWQNFSTVQMLSTEQVGSHVPLAHWASKLQLAPSSRPVHGLGCPIVPVQWPEQQQLQVPSKQ